MTLSDTTIKAAKPQEKAYKITDEKGMFILIQPNGSKYFRFKFYFDKKEKLLALGVYPDISLKQAREKRDIARKQIAEGIDPSEHRKAAKAARVQDVENSFEIIAREWGSKQVKNWDDKNNRNKRMLENNIFPWLGHRTITDILPVEILNSLRRIEERGAIETAHRTLQLCGQVFRYAVATSRIDRDITVDLHGALQSAKGGHFASIIDPKELAPLLCAIDSYSGTFTVKAALQLAPLVFVRPIELRHAQWSEIDFKAREWRYLVTKTQTQHIVPLSLQAIKILLSIHPLTGNGRYVFPSARTPNGSRPMTSEALLAGLRRMGFDNTQMTVHGFRATARTIMDEVLAIRPDFIEHQLAHSVKDPNGRAYNRTAHLPERHKMMQLWADYLDEIKTSVSPIKTNR
jgi:integrase